MSEDTCPKWVVSVMLKLVFVYSGAGSLAGINSRFSKTGRSYQVNRPDLPEESSVTV